LSCPPFVVGQVSKCLQISEETFSRRNRVSTEPGAVKGSAP
jgi:hypothetical protein